MSEGDSDGVSDSIRSSSPSSSSTPSVYSFHSSGTALHLAFNNYASMCPDDLVFQSMVAWYGVACTKESSALMKDPIHQQLRNVHGRSFNASVDKYKLPAVGRPLLQPHMSSEPGPG